MKAVKAHFFKDLNLTSILIPEEGGAFTGKTSWGGVTMGCDLARVYAHAEALQTQHMDILHLFALVSTAVFTKRQPWRRYRFTDRCNLPCLLVCSTPSTSTVNK